MRYLRVKLEIKKTANISALSLQIYIKDASYFHNVMNFEFQTVSFLNCRVKTKTISAYSGLPMGLLLKGRYCFSSFDVMYVTTNMLQLRSFCSLKIQIDRYMQININCNPLHDVLVWQMWANKYILLIRLLVGSSSDLFQP